ncbi:hypothetical protein H7200_01340 [Candidatus Saccharibacteria bacterium]|nr:hypothetical protein [Candidatus Saccharibacteria bacterium]
MQNDTQPIQPVPTQATPQPELAVPTPVTPGVPAPEKKKMSKVLKIVLIAVGSLIVLGAIGAASLFFILGQAAAAPLKASNSFIDAVQAGESSKAYALTTTAFQEATTAERLTTLVEGIKSEISGDEKVTGQVVKSTDGVNYAAVAYSVENDGQTRYMRVVLKQEGSDWKVQNFNAKNTVLKAEIE